MSTVHKSRLLYANLHTLLMHVNTVLAVACAHVDTVSVESGPRVRNCVQLLSRVYGHTSTYARLLTQLVSVCVSMCESCVQ